MTQYAIGWKQANGIGRQKPFDEMQDRVKAMNARLNELEREKKAREQAEIEENQWLEEQMVKELPF